jgi:hypothetical protein
MLAPSRATFTPAPRGEPRQTYVKRRPPDGPISRRHQPAREPSNRLYSPGSRSTRAKQQKGPKRAHNPKVAGSNPAPATREKVRISGPFRFSGAPICTGSVGVKYHFGVPNRSRKQQVTGSAKRCSCPIEGSHQACRKCVIRPGSDVRSPWRSRPCPACAWLRVRVRRREMWRERPEVDPRDTSGRRGARCPSRGGECPSEHAS